MSLGDALHCMERRFLLFFGFLREGGEEEGEGEGERDGDGDEDGIDILDSSSAQHTFMALS